MSWDVHTKLLLKECPQDFVSYFTPGARYIGMRETQYQTRLDSPHEKRELRSDLLIEAEENGQHFLIDPEIQSTKDEGMDERLLGYNYEGTRLHKMNVLSSVFYLRPVSKAPRPPLERSIPNGFKSLWFNFMSIEIAEKSVDDFRQLDLDGFRPWMVLCKDGASREVVDEVLTYLQSRGRGNLILLTKFYADMVFTKDDDVQWLQRRFLMMQEFLWENTKVYQDILSLGTEKGLAQGLEKGLQQGQVKEAQQNIEVVTQARFPDLLPFVHSRVESLDDLARLRELLVLVSTAQNADEVKQGLADPS